MQRLKRYPQCVWFVSNNGRVMVGRGGGGFGHIKFAVTAARLVMVIGLSGLEWSPVRSVSIRVRICFSRE